MPATAKKLKVDLSRLPDMTNDTFYPLYKCKSRYMVLKGGGSSGKSVFCAQKIIFRLLAERGHKFLVVRKVKADLRDSCFAELISIIRTWGLGDLFYIPTGRSSDLYLRCNLNGNEVIFYGLDDVERRKSLSGITSMWIEEASELTTEDFRQLDIRMRGKSKTYKQIILSFNPISITHWLKKEFFDQTKEDCTTHESTYKDNRFLPVEDRKVLEGFKDTDEYYYTVYCLGQWGAVGKTVYAAKIVTDRLQEVKNLPCIAGDFVYKYENERIVDSSIEFVENPAGMVRIYQQPGKAIPYVIGGDTAEGGKDYCTASVRNNLTWQQAAVFQGQIDTDLYAKQMYCLGRWYNNALIGVETNFDLHPVKELDRLRYPRQYMREKIDEITKKIEYKHGFKTTKITRPAILSKHIALAREHIDTFNDVKLLEEMLAFARNSSGRPEAAEGQNDDLIFADAIALEIRGQQTMSLNPALPFLSGGFSSRPPKDFDGERGRDRYEDLEDVADGIPGFYGM